MADDENSSTDEPPTIKSVASEKEHRRESLWMAMGIRSPQEEEVLKRAQSLRTRRLSLKQRQETIDEITKAAGTASLEDLGK
ncbi:unnamed protein product [Bursaphelenchus okinawaensis]|uniref:Uncharacterized protein n=1 Tax=Bursaphelenchus okinawaensis TaxID=465554 RepID=A0A811JVK2_9BILA|nr:unnamed protein product [Bursaphelenchus okinawaensis]CAG9085980.1 unnamed protein product [Bursaphelenchus okinawaensis]